MKVDTYDIGEMTARSASQVRTQAIRPETGLSDILMMLWRRKLIIIATVLLSSAITVAVLLSLTPIYSATTTIAMDRRGMTIADLKQVASGLPGDESTFSGEIEILRSRDLAARIVDELELVKNPEFNKYLVPDVGVFSRARKWVRSIASSEPPDLSEDESLKLQRAATVNEFLSNLDVAQVGSASRVIEIGFSSKDRQLAALVSNTVADLYLKSQVETKIDAARRANEILEVQISSLRDKVRESDKAVEDYRKQSGLLKGADVTLTGQQTAEINSQLVLAEAGLAEAEARYQQIQSLMSSAGGVESAAQVLGSPLVKSLREKQSELERNLAELSIVFGPMHPTIIKVKAEKQDLERTIQAEMDKIVQGYENEVQIAKARYDSMRRSLNKLEREVGEANTAQIELRSLEREARANQAMLESFLSRFKETSAQQDIGIFLPDAKIISQADVPFTASFPNKTLFLALSVVSSAMLGLLLVFALESMDQGLRSSVDVEEGLGVPLLALIPSHRTFNVFRRAPADYVAKNKSSALAQSIRALAVGISLYKPEKAPETILITSVQPGEGKTTISVCLARVSAMAGKRVVVIDADFHKPNLVNVLGVKNGRGFADVLSGDAKLENVIYTDKASGAYFIPAGNVTANSPDALGSKKAKELLHQLWLTFDMVIIDSPPLLAVPDARILAEIADATVLVARWGKTKRNAVRMGVRQIESSGKLAGIALSQVDVRKNAQYGHPESGAYHGALSYYYTK
ncbi:MAG: polysaccharide biosynthesis tyrosine autokinase [Woeseia sp.]|nr:polysaccharide biosynthesis tyrosine autokinase [Woeseia sp.]